MRSNAMQATVVASRFLALSLAAAAAVNASRSGDVVIVAPIACIEPPCVGDILADRTLKDADLGAPPSYWGPATSSPFPQTCDLNFDASVDDFDLGQLLANWKACP